MVSTMKYFFNVIKSEYKHFFKESGAMLIMIIGVIAYSIFYMFPYSSEVIKDVPVAVIDNDCSSLSKEFIRRLDASDSLKVVSKQIDVNTAKNKFFNNEIRGYIIIPNTFEKDILRGKQSVVSLYADSSYLILYKSVYSGTFQTATELGARIEVGKMMKKGMPKQLAMAIKQPFEFVTTPLYNPAGGYATYVYPMILILILHQTLVVGIGLMQGTKYELKESFCEEKKSNLNIDILAKCTAYVVLYLFYSIFYFLIYPALVVYPMSYNIIPLFMLLVPLFYGAALFSYTISYFFKTRESALLLLVVTSLIFIFIPGLIWPREAIPNVINIISFFVPATCGVDGIIKINQMNATFWDVKYDFLWLIFLCVLYFYTAKSVITKNCSKIGVNKKD